MTGLWPVVAIGEAKRMATAWGFTLIEIRMEVTTPFDFAVSDKGITSLVRVRRLKYNSYRIEISGHPVQSRSGDSGDSPSRKG